MTVYTEAAERIRELVVETVETMGLRPEWGEVESGEPLAIRMSPELVLDDDDIVDSVDWRRFQDDGGASKGDTVLVQALDDDRYAVVQVVTEGDPTFTLSGLQDQLDALQEQVDGLGSGSVDLPWRVQVDPFLTPATQTDFATLAVDANQLHNGYKLSTGAQNAEIGWDLLLGAGTWTISLLHATTLDRGIYTVSLDGVGVGVVDGYSAVLVRNVVSAITGVVVAASGKKRLLVKMATKHGSSSSFVGGISSLALIRTA